MDRIVQFGAFDKLIGMLSEANKKNYIHNNPVVIILNAGLIHRIGPNRIYLKLARRLSEIGFYVFRFDFSGIGDSEYRQDNLPFVKSAPQEVSLAMDYLCKTIGTNTFILIGHCSGVEASIRTSLDDLRVVGAVLVNPPAPDTQEAQRLEDYVAHWRKALFSPKSWVRLIIGKSDYRRIMNSIFEKMLRFREQKPENDTEAIEFLNFIKKAFRNILMRRVKVLFITSGIDIGMEYYKRNIGKEMKMFLENDLVESKRVPEADHTFSPLSSQEKLFLLIQEWIMKFQMHE